MTNGWWVVWADSWESYVCVGEGVNGWLGRLNEGGWSGSGLCRWVG